MDPERWHRARALFELALDYAPAQWDALLAGCDDAEVRAEARALLNADLHHSTTSALAARAPDLLEALAEGETNAAAEGYLGKQFGVWRILQLLGQGGMGAVYLAERIEGGFTQRAALKLVRPGLGGEDLLARFRYERQILAALEHPNIARLLDGGAGPDGEPFLALEYVEGEDLRDYCDTGRLGLDARLRLFLTVCAAVEHAHARLIVHRDLKPSNILVAADGSVKLLDFGIAKLLDAAHATEATVARLRMFTPEYAAPEQVRGEPASTAVDVYALGVLLYELLTGRRPYRVDRSSAQAIERAVLTQEPGRPSSVVTRGTEGDSLSAVALAERRNDTAPRLRARLRGDLDAIVLKALRKVAADRYASVRLLAEDIQAHLERRPVAARHGSRRYRSARFVQRHAVAVGFSTLALCALLTGLGVALWQAHEASVQRDAAQAEAATSQATLEFMTGLFALADPGESQGKQVTARELLARGTERIRDQLRDQPAARAELLRAMGEAHLGLGLYQQALPLLDEARQGAADSSNATRSHAIALQELGRYQEALDELLTLRDLLEHAAPRDVSVIARVDLRIAMALQSLNQLDAANVAYRRALEAQRDWLGAQHRETQETILRYASLLVLRDREDDAHPLTAAVVDAVRKQQPRDDAFLARAIGAHAMVVSNTGPVAEAEALRREQIRLNEAIYGVAHPRTLASRNDLAAVLYAQRRYESAATLFEQVLVGRRAQYGPDHPAVATVGNNLATALLALDRASAAHPHATDALRIRLSTYGENHHTTAASLRSLASAELGLGKPALAQPLAERSVAAFEASLGPDNPTMLGAINDLVRIRLARDQPDAGCALAQRALALSGSALEPEQPEAQYQYALLGACQVAVGDATGLATLRHAVPILRDAFGTDDPRTRAATRLLSRYQHSIPPPPG